MKKNMDIQEYDDQWVRSILSHAMLGDSWAEAMPKETFDLMVKETCKYVQEIRDGKHRIHITFRCNLDQQQCSEECHGSPELKKKCSFCSFEEVIF